MIWLILAMMGLQALWLFGKWAHPFLGAEHIPTYKLGANWECISLEMLLARQNKSANNCLYLMKRGLWLNKQNKIFKETMTLLNHAKHLSSVAFYRIPPHSKMISFRRKIISGCIYHLPLQVPVLQQSYLKTNNVIEYYHPGSGIVLNGVKNCVIYNDTQEELFVMEIRINILLAVVYQLVEKFQRNCLMLWLKLKNSKINPDIVYLIHFGYRQWKNM